MLPLKACFATKYGSSYFCSGASVAMNIEDVRKMCSIKTRFKNRKKSKFQFYFNCIKIVNCKKKISLYFLFMIAN